MKAPGEAADAVFAMQWGRYVTFAGEMCHLQLIDDIFCFLKLGQN